MKLSSSPRRGLLHGATYGALLTLLLAMSLPAQEPVPPGDKPAAEQQPPAITERGAHHRVWRRDNSITLGHGRLLSLSFVRTDPFPLEAAPLPEKVWTTNAHGYWVRTIKFRPDGLAVASTSQNDAIKMWNVSDTALIRSFSLGQNGPVTLAFPPNSTRIFGGNGSGAYKTWRVSDSTTIYSGGFSPNGFGQAAYSANGLYLALGRLFGTISLQDATTGIGIHLLEGHNALVNNLDFSPDSTLLGSSSSDDTAKLWRVSDGAMLQSFDYAGGAVAFTSDGKYFCYDKHDGTAAFWDVQTNGIARTFPAWGSAVRFTSNGEILVTVNGPLVNLWRVSTGALLASYDTAPDGTALSVDISPDARLFAYGTYDGTVVLARMPLVINEFTRSGNETVLNWQGGSGLYQLQSNPNFATNGWQNLGPATTNTCATNLSPATLFFRVQSLPNP